MARLHMRRGPSPGTVYPLNGDRVSIGRGSKNDIIIRDNEVSREHCRLMVTAAGQYELLDLNSSNGTYVNGQPAVRAMPLASGALIELGDSVTLIFESEEASPTSHSASVAPFYTDERVPLGQYTLMMITGPEPGRYYELTRPVIAIGRDLSNDIVIQDPEVSRFHARLYRDGFTYTIEDLDSTNGTRVDDAAVTEAVPLYNNTIIYFGTSVQMRVASDVRGSVSAEDSSAPLHPLPRELSPFYEETANISLLKSASRHERRSEKPSGHPLHDHLLVVYAHEDWELFAASVVDSLRDAHLKVWVDRGLTYGDAAWRSAMEKALRECWLMVVILSPRALHLNHIRLSYRTFLNLKKPVIPVAYEPTVTLPLELARHQIIFHDQRNPHRSTQRLILEIKELRRQIKP